MRKTASFFICLVALITFNLNAEPISAEQDELIYRQIMRLAGENGDQYPIPAEELPDNFKSATPYLISLANQARQGSSKTQQAWLSLVWERYDDVAPDTFGSPGGNFLIHYAPSGVHAPWQGNLGNNPATGVPVFVEKTADIFDSVWTHMMDDLGFDPPPDDSFYASGGDYRFDVYLADLCTLEPDLLCNAYGATFPDVLTGPNNQYATAFMVLDNDFQEIDVYKDKPLDAIRVTAAHEFFHVVQFGYDYHEFEDMGTPGTTADDRHHWLEMSSVWMEEEIYDNINDYYYYLPSYFSLVHRSLQTNNPGIYQYAAVVWPLFLSEMWGRDAIRIIWEKCRETMGPNVFQDAIPEAIDELSGGEYDMERALSEFYTWVYFTGDRTKPNFGYEEAPFYPMVADYIVRGRDTINYMPIFNEYPFTFADPRYEFLPDHNGAFYIRMNNLSQLDSVLNIQFRGSTRILGRDIVWHNRIVALNEHIPTQPPYIDDQVYDDSFSVRLDESIINNYSEIVLILSPNADIPANRSIINRVTFVATSSGTSSPIEDLTISDPFPNPYVLSQSGGQDLLIRVEQPEPANIMLRIFNLAGEKVTEKEIENPSPVELVRWDARNDGGEMVASGMYLLYITAGDSEKVSKVAIIE